MKRSIVNKYFNFELISAQSLRNEDVEVRYIFHVTKTWKGKLLGKDFKDWVNMVGWEHWILHRIGYHLLGIPMEIGFEWEDQSRSFICSKSTLKYRKGEGCVVG